MRTPKSTPDIQGSGFGSESAADKENKLARCERSAHDAASATSGDKASEETPYQPIFANIAKVMCQNGAAYWQLALAFQVDENTIREWTRTYKDFAAGCKYGMNFADDTVERSLYELAVGYEHRDVKIFRYKGQVIYAPYTKHVVASVPACIFWLINRRPEEWSLDPERKLDAAEGNPFAKLYESICGTKLMPNEDQTAWLEREDYFGQCKNNAGEQPKAIDPENSNED